MACWFWTPDLMDASRFGAGWQRLPGVPSPDPVALEGLTSADVVVLDLGRLPDVKTIPEVAGRIVAFVPHVESELAAAGRARGWEVHARSRFFGSVLTQLTPSGQGP